MTKESEVDMVKEDKVTLKQCECNICARKIINELKQLAGIKRNLEELVKQITA